MSNPPVGDNSLHEAHPSRCHAGVDRGGGDALCLAAGTVHAAPFPVTSDAATAIATRYLNSASESPAGANRFDCRDRDGRNPVVLLHATAMNQSANWAYLAPTLANAGYCVFRLTYGQTS